MNHLLGMISNYLYKMKQNGVFDEIAGLWIGNYETILLQVKKTFELLNFENIDDVIKKKCIFLVENGFYTYGRMSCSFDMNIESICKMVEDDSLSSKIGIIKILPTYKKEINEIYGLYNQHRYRLCILSIINVISTIFNSNFNYLDFTEINVNNLKKYKILNSTNQEYFIFIPYMIDVNESNKRNYKNKILVNAKDNKYKDMPYNRNAILHGYYKDFGNKENCLRWFSVLLNSVDLIKIYNKTKEVK